MTPEANPSIRSRRLGPDQLPNVTIDAPTSVASPVAKPAIKPAQAMFQSNMHSPFRALATRTKEWSRRHPVER